LFSAYVSSSVTITEGLILSTLGAWDRFVDVTKIIETKGRNTLKVTIIYLYNRYDLANVKRAEIRPAGPGVPLGFKSIFSRQARKERKGNRIGISWRSLRLCERNKARSCL
jgi:hypothetical protein